MISHIHQPMCCTIERGAIHLLGRATLTQQLRDITHPLAHASTQTSLGAQQNKAQRTSIASTIIGRACDITHPPAICSRGQFPCTAEQSAMHRQSGQLLQSNSVLSHNRQPMCCAIEQGTIHTQGERLSQSKPAISHGHRPMCCTIERGTTHIKSKRL